MSKSQNQLAMDGWSDPRGIGHPALTLEKQLTNTIELRWHVQQTRFWSNDATPVKIRRLFDEISSELQIFTDMIRNRLESLPRSEQRFTNGRSDSDWHVFPSDNLNLCEQLEALLTGYARYARQTSKAITTLRRRDELQCGRLLETMFVAADRHMCFLEMYLEGLTVNTNTMRLPDWPTGRAAEITPTDSRNFTGSFQN